MKRTLLATALVCWAGVATAHAITWAVDYDCSVLPDAATDAWTHAKSPGGTTAVDAGILTLTSGTGGSSNQNSWDRTSDPALSPATAIDMYYNNPDTPGSTPALVTGRSFTVEWRMKVDGPANLTTSDQVGMKLEIGMGSLNAQYTMYYDAANQRLVNEKWSWGNHEGRMGAEGAEAANYNDGFEGIALGSWHTYKITASNMSGIWFRELWLDGDYVGRWWTESSAGSGGSNRGIKMRSYSSKAGASVSFDYLRYSNEADGRYIMAVPEPATLVLLASGILFLRRRRA